MLLFFGLQGMRQRLFFEYGKCRNHIYIYSIGKKALDFSTTRHYGELLIITVYIVFLNQLCIPLETNTFPKGKTKISLPPNDSKKCQNLTQCSEY